MKKLLTIILLLVVLTSCHHKSLIKSERGFIVEKQFSPSFTAVGTGVGMSMSGNMVVTTNTSHKPEQFMLVFKCEHDVVFTIDNQQLYTDLNKGDSVSIRYFEILNNDNEVVDLDFVSAIKLNL
jgi:hypothetical protein